METKICKKCGLVKELCEFDIRLTNKDKRSNRCKTCRRNYFNEYNKKNSNKRRQKQKEWYWNNHDKELKRSKEKHKKFRENEKEYRKKNRDKINEKIRERYQNDEIFKLKTNMKNRLKLFLKSKNIRKDNTTFGFIGCDPETLKKHIENQFTEGMSWENYGYYGWHIDHIIPLSSAKTKEDVYSLTHFTNLQPLWCNENYKKSNKIL